MGDHENNIATEKPAAPQHIGIIMDGNGRWAKKRNYSRTEGHKEGAENFRRIATYAKERGAKYLSVYAFSTENWTRSGAEIEQIMGIMSRFLDIAIRDAAKLQIRMRLIGDRSALSDRLVKKIEKAEKLTEHFDCICNVAINYGGRDEIVYAANRAFLKKQSEISSSDLSDELYTAGQPDPDLIIRTSGEMRISNFMLWQSAYSEYIFSEKMWPEFTKEDFDLAVLEYYRRNRRFGGV